jgi:NADPH-dependent curcumin reductase CurA
MSYPAIAQQVHLVRRPDGPPTPEDFGLVKVPAPVIGTGEVLVHNLVVSLSAGMRTLIDGSSGSLPNYQVGAAMYGPALGEIIASNAPELVPGDLVQHRGGQQVSPIARGDCHCSNGRGGGPLSSGTERGTRRGAKTAAKPASPS